ncbi:MAG: ribbon-helix-helix protein, CopG family [Mycobacteriales bacterium]
MKTAISIPDDTFSRVEQCARALGMSRSQFYTVAARRYLDHLDEESRTRQIDEALAALGDADDSASTAVNAGRRRVAASDDAW